MSGLGRRHAVGVLFLVVIVALIAGFVQYYRQALWFQHSVDITLVTPAAGLSLDPPADVKLRGVLVGEVRSVSANGTDAVLHIALDPSQRSLVPADVDAAIVPKTLFGEKYVALILPTTASGPRIAAGDVIRQSPTSVEVQQVFTDVLPILQTLRPDLVSATLTAMATALDGRGEELGQTLTKLDSYLRGIEPELPTLVHDTGVLAATANLYADHADQILQTLDNVRAVSDELLVPDQAGITTLLASVTQASNTLRGFLDTSGDTVVSLSGQALPVLKVLSQYSVALPCLVHGFVVGNSLTDHALGGSGPFLRVTVDLPSAQHRVYTAPADLPSTPTSDANVNQLDQNVSSWAPYCTQVAARNENVPDVGPLSYNYHGGTSSSATATDGIGAAGGSSQVAMAQALGATSVQAPLSALLLGPLMSSGMVVP